MTDAEMELIKQKGSGISHCPNSNTSLVRGAMPTRKFFYKVIKIGLATDAGGYSNSIFNAIRECIGVSKLLDRMLIIATEPYSQSEIRQILAVIAAEEDVKLGQQALDRLVQIATTPGASLGYAMQLIMAANCARARRRTTTTGEVELADVKRVWRLFLDAGRSAESL